MTEPNEMEALAQAALYVPELARGVSGTFKIQMNGTIGQEDWRRTLEEIHDAQRVLFEAGWRRDRRAETLAPYNTWNVEVGFYWKQFPNHDQPHWIQINITTRFGLYASFTGLGTRTDPL